MDSFEAAGTTIEEAVDAALRELKAVREDVEIEVLENPGRGLLGLVAGRTARIRATRIERSVASEDAATTPSEAGGASSASKVLVQRAAQLLRDIVLRIGVEAEVAIRAHDEGVLLELTGDTSGILIGRHGQMLDALEYVVNRALLRDDENALRVMVDANGYRVRRRASLEDLAHRMAEQAKRKGEPITLSPMPPQDRRIIHLALQGDPLLTTRSSGDGVLRRLVIIPEGAAFQAHDYD